MARTFTKEEFQIALDRALAQKLAEEAGSEEDEEPSQQDDEDDEQIGVAALGLISKKRKHSSSVEEIFESSGSSSSSSSSSSSRDHKRIAVVAKTDIKCAGTSAAHFFEVAEKLQSHTASTKLSHDKEELDTIFSTEQRLIITQVFTDFRDEDGLELDDAENWMQWGDNVKLGEVLKTLFPKNEAISYPQRLKGQVFGIKCIQNGNHVLPFLGKIQAKLDYEDRKAELQSLNPQEFKVLKDAIMGCLKVHTDSVTSQFVARVQLLAASNIRELFSNINHVGKEFHNLYLQNQLLGIHMFADKPTKDHTSDVKIHCEICNKEHIGGAKACRFKTPKEATTLLKSRTQTATAARILVDILTKRTNRSRVETLEM